MNKRVGEKTRTRSEVRGPKGRGIPVGLLGAYPCSLPYRD